MIRLVSHYLLQRHTCLHNAMGRNGANGAIPTHPHVSG